VAVAAVGHGSARAQGEPMSADQQAPVEPVDSDVDLHVAAQRRQRGWDPGVLVAIALGGIAGAEARYGLSVLLPHHPGQWPMATWLTNVSGCFLIGVLMVVITELTSPHRLVRPFLGVGVLGGYTTFSTAMVDVQQMALAGHAGAALGYMFATLAAAMVAVFLGMLLTRGSATWWLRMRRTFAGGRR
jgi:CrcB protein